MSIPGLVGALQLWSETIGGTANLLNHSENHTFRIDTPSGQRFSLRVHRPGYQSRATIQSELAWLLALRHDTGLPVPCPIAGSDGKLLQSFSSDGHEPRLAVLFAHVPGQEPSASGDLAGLFAALGGFAARMHRHAMAWSRPPGFSRQVWSAKHILAPDGLWGDWRTAPGVTPELSAVLDRVDSALRQQLAAYGTGADRFGLIHADMRLGNLLLDEDRVTLIDFDDCGFCWFAYDFAAAISFHETRLAIPALKAAWLEGYSAIRPLPRADIAAMDTMVMLRRMALLAWIGSHGETNLARTHAPGFALGTVQLAQSYLRTVEPLR
ncbi:phosphotransferase enzyme family protein [uncultured Devosia sp.]|uniref:phosphotransferase enzyme family protein n=1 Tax=uncultured Devosia sp. TaxID=211434 RepID=UPI0035CB1EBE